MFFTKLVACLAFVAPLVSALTISTPTNWTSGGPAVITWTAVNGDPQVFSIELVNTVFNNAFALANNIETGVLTLNLNLPAVPPGNGYTVEFVNPANISNVQASSGSFSIGDTVSSSTSSTSSSAISGSSASPATLTNVVSTGTTQSATAKSATATTASSQLKSSSASVPSSSTFNSGAIALGISHTNLAGFAVMAAAALAGARLVGF